MTHTDPVTHCFQDPLRRAIIGDHHDIDEPRRPLFYMLLSTMVLVVFLLMWFREEIMFSSYFYFQLLMSLCS